MSARAEPVGGRLMTLPFRILSMFAILGAVLIAWRMVVGLGPATGLSDSYPWGLWISFGVVTGTALGCGGYAVAILLYILNRGGTTPSSGPRSSPVLWATRWPPSRS